MSADSILTHVVGAVAVIICVSHAVGRLFRRIRQPEVIGQLLAGIVLGSSALGRLPGQVSQTIFPSQIVEYLNVISQLALIAFLFAVGYELDLRVLRRQRRRVPAIAAVTFFVPAVLGIASVYAFGTLYRSVGDSPVHTQGFALFMGVAVAITAVPVLASIIEERRILDSEVGVTALASAALIDAVGWIALAAAIVLGNVSSTSHRSWWITVSALSGYVAVGWFLVRPLLARLLNTSGSSRAVRVPVATALALSSAWVTAYLGLHVFFGALFAGLIMPRRPDGRPDPELLRSAHQTGGLLLPVFFMVAGLSVDVGTLNSPGLLLLGIILVIAVLGKIGAGFAAGKWAGLSTRDSAAVGIMLDTRGLTELIAVNAALTVGLIHQRLYTILVLMALITTVSTGPLLSWLERSRTPRTGSLDPGKLVGCEEK